MGRKAEEPLEIDFEGFQTYLRSKTRVFMDVDGDEYYVTHTDGYWRVQDCSKLNDKGRFTDCSELVSTMPRLLSFRSATVRASTTCLTRRRSTSPIKRAGSSSAGTSG